MKESISYTVVLNIVFTFIIIVFAFLSAIIIYFKSNKVTNLITSSIEKYAGYNDSSITEISTNLSSMGYNVSNINCKDNVTDSKAEGGSCNWYGNTNYKEEQKKRGYCIYLCLDESSDSSNKEEYYYFKVRTNFAFNVPIINQITSIPIYTNTNEMYNFGCKFDSDCIG